jgi:hypothetical protein
MGIQAKSAACPLKPSRYAGHLVVKSFGMAVLVAAVVVFLVGRFTNHLNPEWDMIYYQDMAEHGILGNHHLVAPFAYRFAAPLIVGAVARATHTAYTDTFRACAQLMSMVFILACFAFARVNQGSDRTALFAAVLIALNLYIVKWSVLAGSMVDIYAYPLLLLGFWAVMARRFYLVLLISVAGLFVKEFLLLPLVTQAGMMILDNYRANRWKLIRQMALTGAVLVVCFLLPRVVIPVVDSLQDIDPHQLWKLRRLISYPANPKRWFNIAFAYFAVWLPVLLLFTRCRWRLVRTRLYPHRTPIFLFLAFHLLLVMYGGTNIVIFVTYSAPVEMLALVILLDCPDLQRWEPFVALAVVILFNREWMSIPLPQYGLDPYLNFYGGYYHLVTWRSVWRFAEAFAYIIGFWGARAVAMKRDGSPANPRTEIA